MSDTPQPAARPSDEELARMLAERQPGALAELMERYGAHVLSVAEAILQHREDALDTAQEAFLKACQEIQSLRNPARVGAWLTSIARNHALDKVRRRRHRPLVLQMGGVPSAPTFPQPADEAAAGPSRQLQMKELRQEVRRGLAELSDRYAETVEMFYLTGMSVAAIAQRLDVPVGTVKWRLSRARALLREELIMSDVTDALRNEVETPPLLDVSNVNGRTGPDTDLQPWRVCRTLLAQQVLFAARKQRKTPPQIAREVKADVDYVRDHLACMKRAEVLEEKDGSYRANCILFDAEDVRSVREQLAPRGDRVATVVRAHEAALSEAIRETSPADRGFEESYLRWIVVPPLLLNCGLGRTLQDRKYPAPDPPHRPDGGRWFFLPSLSECHLPWELGCNWNIVPGQGGYAQYWNSELSVPITGMRNTEIALLRRLADGPVRRASATDVFSEETVAALVEKGVARAEGEDLVTNVPIFHPADGDRLDPVISAVVDGIVEQAYGDFPEDVYSVLDEQGFSFARADYPGWAHILAQTGSVRALRRDGVLADPPEPVPAGWGFFAWTGLFAPVEGYL